MAASRYVHHAAAALITGSLKQYALSTLSAIKCSCGRSLHRAQGTAICTEAAMAASTCQGRAGQGALLQLPATAA